MADTIAIRRRIRSITSTRQITKAMQLVAASKLRAATNAAERATNYREVLDEILSKAAANPDWSLHPLVQSSATAVTRVVLIGSDRGLAGPYHSRLETTFRQVINQEKTAGREIRVTAIGRNSSLIAGRYRNQVTVDRRLPGFNVLPTMWEIAPAADRLLEEYRTGETGRIILIATRFYSALRQQADATELLPLGEITPAEGAPVTLEPDAEAAITAAITALLQARLFDGAASAIASEQAMRMLAMQNATTNAGDMIDDLTLAYNTARQAAITQELAEISGGVAALS